MVVSCLLLIPVLGASGADAIWKDLVSYPASSYRAVPWNDFRAYGADLPVSGLRSLLNPSQIAALLKWSLIYLISPGIYVLCAIRLASRQQSLNESELRTVLLLTIIGMSLFLSIAYSPTLKRMGIVSLPALVLLFWLFRSDGKFARCFTLGLTLFAGLTLPAGIIHSQHTSLLISTPSGNLAISDSRSLDIYDQYMWLRHNTQPGDVVYSAGCLEFNYLFKLKDPVRIPLLSTYDYTTRQQVQDTIEDLNKSRTKFVFWPVALQRITLNTDAVFNVQDHLEPLRIYLQTDYRLVNTFNNLDQVWQRKEE